jgi:hypothetical protein
MVIQNRLSLIVFGKLEIENKKQKIENVLVNPSIILPKTGQIVKVK